MFSWSDGNFFWSYMCDFTPRYDSFFWFLNLNFWSTSSKNLLEWNLFENFFTNENIITVILFFLLCDSILIYSLHVFMFLLVIPFFNFFLVKYLMHAYLYCHIWCWWWWLLTQFWWLYYYLLCTFPFFSLFFLFYFYSMCF